ncbi:DUF2171 domain-containing protein [Sphingomicrobium lutaoense]|uniref:DUF2171 domain-containing protein n=1 Tax=Sphingomicrobium lutaoense TaxID=515949 RepID=A0A839Z3N8_9SPHN|nr:DUF2171 domain-containing protein [Sphingomicrobium lutaoense]MBB3763204.1 hypothetical protein [Sphingomicrobium lutaoense]
MAHDRYEQDRSRRGQVYGRRGEQSAWSREDERGQWRDRDFDRGSMRPSGYDRDERDFFDRASDEVRSWFGDERAQQRREYDERMDRERGEYGWGRDYDRGARDMDEGYRRPYTGRRQVQPPHGRWGRDDDRAERYDYDRGYTQNRFGRPMTEREYTHQDSDYSNWRRRQIDELDRDYAEWRSENRKRFDDEFTSWREERRTKRQMLREIPDHAEVVGSDGEHVGTVDKVRGDRIIMTRDDSEDGHHHSLTCSRLDCIEDGKVKLNLTAEEAKSMWRDEERDRALGERSDQGEDGPHMLERSFSNTY